MSECVFDSSTPLTVDFVAWKRRVLSIDFASNLEDNSICIIKYTKDGSRFLLLNDVICISGKPLLSSLNFTIF